MRIHKTQSKHIDQPLPLSMKTSDDTLSFDIYLVAHREKTKHKIPFYILHHQIDSKPTYCNLNYFPSTQSPSVVHSRSPHSLHWQLPELDLVAVLSPAVDSYSYSLMHTIHSVSARYARYCSLHSS